MIKIAKVELRADGLHIVGYVNIPGRTSRPVITPRGRVIEVIEQRAFQRAIGKMNNIDLLLDHERKIASTSDSTLKVFEDEVGLRAEAYITDEEVIDGAKNGKLKGWSFQMKRITDEIEERAGQLPLRKIKDFVMPEVSLIMHKNPVYSSTSIELRADEEEATETEMRACDSDFEVKEMVETPKETKVDLSQYKSRINKLKVGR